MFVSTKGASKRDSGFGAPFVLSRSLRALLAAVGLSLAPSYLAAQPSLDTNLQELSALADAGMEQLSLALVENNQPLFEEDADGWMSWQQQKLNIYVQRGQWDRLIQAYDALPEAVSEEFRSTALIQVVQAYLAMGDGESARDLLLPLIWEFSVERSQAFIWRRLVVQSYLVEGRLADAQTAAIRFEQDFDSKEDSAWVALKGRVLISAGKADDAVIETLGDESAAGQAVNVLARLKGYTPLDEALFQQVLSALHNASLDQDVRQQLFEVAYDKSRILENWAERISILERLINVEQIGEAQVATAADALWLAYREYGKEISNRLQLLVGDFTAWFDSASRLRQASATQARALYVWLAHSSDDAVVDIDATRMFVETLSGEANSEQLLRALYLSSTQFSDVSALPTIVMYRLVDTALSEGDIALASKLMSQMDAPEGVELVEWQLRRARVQVLAGVPEYGAELLEQLAMGHLNTDQFRYLLVAIFDLQNAGRNEKAYEILNHLLGKAPELSLYQEVLFWMADAKLAQNDYTEAARLFLRAAAVKNNGSDTMTDWAQRARYQAAEAMVQAGLADDAVKLYRQLLTDADQAYQRTLLQRKIQRRTSTQ